MNDERRALLARITVEPGKMGGKPIVRGRRITVETVLGYLAAGVERAEILRNFPFLEDADIDACLLYAQRLAARSTEPGLAVAAE
jgi:uncharacterized protein (DUF433 family)